MSDSITTSATPPGSTAPVTVEDTPFFWPLVALEAWILAREPSAVEAICRTPSDVDKVCVLLACRRRSDKTIQAVRREIRRYMRSGKVPALGDKGNGCETVPPENLSKPFEYLPKTCTYKVGKFGNLGISRDEALKWWPPDPPAAVVEAGAGAISEPEFETKAADVQQEPEEVLVEEASAEVAAAQTEPARKKSDTWGYAADDAPLVDEIIELKDTRKCRSHWQAALQVASRAKGEVAKGEGTLESKAKRLHRQVKEKLRKLRRESAEA